MLRIGVERKITTEEAQQIVETTGMSKSAKIKEMWNGGWNMKEISGIMGILYNHAYNVIQNYVLVNGIEITKAARASGVKRQDIEKAILDGRTNMEVAKEFKVAYNRVWKLKDDMIKEGIIAAPEKKRVVITEKPTVLSDKDLEVLGEKQEAV